jgi:cytochrome P450
LTAPTANDNRALADMPLFDNETLKCPYHFDKTLRENAPVYQDPDTGVYIVATYDLVREAHRTPAVFSNEFSLQKGSGEEIDADVAAAMGSTYDLGKGVLLTVDDPQHQTYRGVVKSFFLAPSVAKYRPWITEQANNIITGLPRGQSFDFIKNFTRPYPLSVIMHVLGMPLDMQGLAFKWTGDHVAALSQTGDKNALIAAHAGIKDHYDWFVGALNERRENPRDDLLSLIANAAIDSRPLTIEEQISYCSQFMVAGNETTTATMAEGMRQLCLNPEQQQKIRDDRSLIPNLVEETLRISSPTSNMWRTTKSEYTLGGVTIPKDSMVLLKYFSSNHDESMFEKPMEFDVTRSNAKRHISFGFGAHVCIGQHLSKLEMIIAWETLFENSSNFVMNTEPTEMKYIPNVLLRGLEEIFITIES